VFDFRYHALSLTAVLAALVVGVLLGIAIGDRNLVSSAENKLRANLRSDVRAANKRADDLRAQVADSKRLDNAVYPLLVGGQLAGRRVGLVFLGKPSDEIAKDVTQALHETGGQLAVRAVLREPIDLSGLADRATGTRYEEIATKAELVEPFGFRMGAQFARSGKLIGRARPALLSSFNGKLQPLDAVIVVRRGPKLDGDAAKARDAFEKGLVHGMVASDIPTVGIETTDTDPSQIPWYRDNDLASIDDIDELAGRAALVFTLQGGADGAYGVKSTADGGLLPDIRGSR
jgi:hypothetical protein